jgi:asparagine N-glycosylation enzyme membrane subunit Stt3
MRALFILGTIVDVLFAAFLLIAVGWIVDSWDDPAGAWVGVVVTTIWAIALLMSAGAPFVGARLRRRKASPERVLLAVWAPPALLAAFTLAGFLIFSREQ